LGKSMSAKKINTNDVKNSILNTRSHSHQQTVKSILKKSSQQTSSAMKTRTSFVKFKPEQSTVSRYDEPRVSAWTDVQAQQHQTFQQPRYQPLDNKRGTLPTQQQYYQPIYRKASPIEDTAPSLSTLLNRVA